MPETIEARWWWFLARRWREAPRTQLERQMPYYFLPSHSSFVLQHYVQGHLAPTFMLSNCVWLTHAECVCARDVTGYLSAAAWVESSAVLLFVVHPYHVESCPLFMASSTGVVF